MKKIRNEYFILRVTIGEKFFLINEMNWESNDADLKFNKIQRWNNCKKYISLSQANKAKNRIKEIYEIECDIITMKALIYDSDGVVIERN